MRYQNTLCTQESKPSRWASVLNRKGIKCYLSSTGMLGSGITSNTFSRAVIISYLPTLPEYFARMTVKAILELMSTLYEVRSPINRSVQWQRKPTAAWGKSENDSFWSGDWEQCFCPPLNKSPSRIPRAAEQGLQGGNIPRRQSYPYVLRFASRYGQFQGQGCLYG